MCGAAYTSIVVLRKHAREAGTASWTAVTLAIPKGEPRAERDQDAAADPLHDPL
ncbi:hypothetical protein ACVIGA_003400 [Bradyrhizobium sp. USDA 3240]